MVPSVVTSAAVCRSPIRPWSAMGGYRSMTVPQRVWRSGAENGSNAQQRQRGRVRVTQRTPGCADRLPGQGQSISRSTRLPASRRENAAKISLTPRMIRYQATKIDTTYRVRPGQAKVTTAAATPKIPATMNSQRHSRTRAATASWLFIVAGILGVAAAVVTFAWPGRTLYVVSILVAWYLIILGVSEIFAAFSLREAGKRVERLID